jgi:hypothetical protein
MEDQNRQPGESDPTGDLDESPVPDPEAKDTDSEDVREAD